MRKFRTGPESDFVVPLSTGNGNGGPSAEHSGNGHGTPSVEYSGNGHEIPQSRGEAELGAAALGLSFADMQDLNKVLEVVARRGDPSEVAYLSPEARRLMIKIDRFSGREQ